MDWLGSCYHVCGNAADHETNMEVLFRILAFVTNKTVEYLMDLSEFCRRRIYNLSDFACGSVG